MLFEEAVAHEGDAADGACRTQQACQERVLCLEDTVVGLDIAPDCVCDEFVLHEGGRCSSRWTGQVPVGINKPHQEDVLARLLV